VKIVRYNPFPPYPPTPESLQKWEWEDALRYYRPFVDWRIRELRDEMVEAGVAPSKLPSVASLSSYDSGLVDTLATALADTRVPSSKFWAAVSPERYVREILANSFGGAKGNKAAEKLLKDEVRILSKRFRDEIIAAGRVPVPPSASALVVVAPSKEKLRPARRKKEEPATVARSAPRMRKRPPSDTPPRAPSAPSKAPSARPPSGAVVAAPSKAPSARPPSSRPPSGRSVGPSEDTPEFRAAMEDLMVDAAAAIAPSDAPPPLEDEDYFTYEGMFEGDEEFPYVDEDELPRFDEGAAGKRRPPPPPPPSDRRAPPPPSAPSGRGPSGRLPELPRLRELSEATLRAEREWFYEDKRASRDQRACPMTRRLAGFWGYRAGIRPPYRPPPEILQAHEDDILLLVTPGSSMVQVFTKGALTEVFASSREEHALNIGARYANQWRGVNPNGSILRDAKRSRLGSGIYAAYYTDNGVSEPVLLAAPIAEVLERDVAMRGRKLANPRSTPRRLMMREEVDAPRYSTIIRIRNPR